MSNDTFGERIEFISNKNVRERQLKKYWRNNTQRDQAGNIKMQLEDKNLQMATITRIASRISKN